MPRADQPQLSRRPGRLRGVRRGVATACLVGLALAQAVIGGWALAAPAHFYATFPVAGHAWVALIPPYNEHLVRDVGGLSLAMAALLGVAGVVATRFVVRLAVAAFAMYAVPHTVFHAVHLEGFPAFDAIAQTSGFVLQLIAGGLALAATIGSRRQPGTSASA